MLPGARAADRTLELNIVNGINTSLDERVRVTQGDHITLLCTADTRVQIHLHGYDIEKTITPDSTVSIRFEAHATGRFPVTLHGADHAKNDPDGHDYDEHDHDHEHDKSPQQHEEPTLFYLEVYPG